jgi:aspartate/tyrosine/aromatic aminotransferase
MDVSHRKLLVDASLIPRTLTECSFLILISLNSYTGISPAQSQALTDKAHVYLTQNGRISMAGLNTHNIRYFAENLDKAVRGEL